VRFRLLVDRADIEATLIFALLHDIGHYPLSHMFEDFRGEQMPAEDPVLIDEELFSPFLTGGEEPAASGDVKMTAKVIKRMLSGELSLAEIISQSFGQRTLDGLLSIHRCADEGYSPSRTIHRMLAALVCSAIDIDKVAYLTADSSATGVPYGQGIDVHGFLTSLRTPIVALTTGSGPVLGVDEKGLAAVESVILARYWMVSRVYWHHTNRAVMAAFKFVISQLKEHGKLRFSDYFAETFWDSEVEAARRLSAHFNELEEVRANMLLNPIQGLIDGRRIIYKRLVTVSKLQEDDLYEKMVHRGEGPAISCAMEALEDFLPENERRRGSVLVDVPRTQRDSISLEEIRILSDPEAGGLTPDRPLGEASPLLKQLRTEFVNEAKKCRVLIDREAYQALEHQGKLEGVRKAIRERLSRGLA
jgi:HD superfamily phosphohydrolase